LVDATSALIIFEPDVLGQCPGEVTVRPMQKQNLALCAPWISDLTAGFREPLSAPASADWGDRIARPLQSYLRGVLAFWIAIAEFGGLPFCWSPRYITSMLSSPKLGVVVSRNRQL
jgi:hypothetical protein